MESEGVIEKFSEDENSSRTPDVYFNDEWNQNEDVKYTYIYEPKKPI
jgi:hypothetical protein